MEPLRIDSAIQLRTAKNGIAHIKLTDPKQPFMLVGGNIKDGGIYRGWIIANTNERGASATLLRANGFGTRSIDWHGDGQCRSGFLELVRD